MSVIVQVTTIKLTDQNVYGGISAAESALKVVVIRSITNIHMKNTVGVKIAETIEP